MKYLFWVPLIVLISCQQHAKPKAISKSTTFLFKDSFYFKAYETEGNASDSFLINKQWYVMQVNPNDSSAYTLCERDSGKLIPNINFNYGHEYYLENDYNNDGFKDFEDAYTLKEFSLHLYNPNSLRFDTTPVYFSRSNELIDTAKLLYWTQDLAIRNEIDCELLSLANYKPKILYTLRISANENHSQYTYTVYKGEIDYDSPTLPLSIVTATSPLHYHEYDTKHLWLHFLKTNKLSIKD